MTISRQTLILHARTWLGVPFRHQGRNRMGVDCGGLLMAIGQQAGLEIIPPETYSLSPDVELVRKALQANCVEIPLADAQPGDVLLLAFAGAPQHVGLLTDIGLLHAWAKPGKVVEHLIDAQWERRIVAAYAHNEVSA
jgi:cell wall-associated NlpC family hydrolase